MSSTKRSFFDLRVRWLSFAWWTSISGMALAGEVLNGPPVWENHHVLQINREPARAHFFPYADSLSARQGGPSSRVLSLDGEWEFHWVPRPEQKIPDFYKVDFDASDWGRLTVPAHWELNGYGTPIYVSAGYPFKIDPPRVTGTPKESHTAYKERNPVGQYRRFIDVPDAWKGQRLFLHFGGVMSAFNVYVNGVHVGYSQGSNLPSEFEVTAYLRTGQNLIALEVYRWSDGSYLEDQDMWRLSGIHRSIHLYTTPPLRIADFTVRTTFDDAFRDARLSIQPRFSADPDLSPEGWILQARLFGPDGRAVLPEGLQVDVETVMNRDYKASLLVERTPQRGPAVFGWMEALVEQPMHWTAETPNLYRLVLELIGPDGHIAEVVACDVGFRELEIRGGQFLVNGRPVRLRGVNRHEHDPQTGHVLSKERMLEDVLLLKRANVNAVRTAHYPNDPYWYELCDRHGLYVMDEADLETHGLRGHLSSQPDWQPAFMDRAIRLVERDKNYPSVVFWSMGNESGYGPNFAAISAWWRSFDPTRPIHYEGAQRGVGEARDPDTVDVISRFYPRVREPYLNPGMEDGTGVERPENARWERLLDIAMEPGDDRPVLTSEYAHAMGNALGNLREYWDEIYSHPRMLGGFIWDWVDQGLYKTNAEGRRIIAYGGDFGDEPNLKAFCLNGIVFADRGLTPKYHQVKKIYQPVHIEALSMETNVCTLRVTNRHHHTRLESLEGRWTVELDGSPLAAGTFETQGVEPGQSIDLRLAFPNLRQPPPGSAYWLRVGFVLARDTNWAPAGHEVAWEQFLLQREPHFEQATETDCAEIEVKDTGDTVLLQSPGMEAIFSRMSGRLERLRLNGLEVLQDAAAGPVLQAFRAPTDNDKGFGKWLAADWRQAGLATPDREVTAFEVESIRAGIVEVRVRTKNSFATGHIETDWRYRLRGDGSVDIRAQFVPFGALPHLPRIGLALRGAEHFERVRWYGHGPWENYADRLDATPVGIWEGDIDEQAVPYPRPQETGNREGIRWFSLRASDGTGVLVASLEEPVSMSAIRHTAAELQAVRHHAELVRRADVVVTVNAAHAGLGNSSCGPGVLQRYALGDGPWHLALRLLPLAAGDSETERLRIYPLIP